MKARTGIGALAALALVGLILYHYSRPTVPAPSAAGTDSFPAQRALLPRLPAPRIEVKPASTEPPADLVRTNQFAQWFHGEKLPVLTREQVEPYLTANRRNAGSLLTAFWATEDPTLLQEAKAKYPNDPQVAYAAAFNNASPEERREWLDALQRSAPDNSLANYLSAFDAFKAGQTDRAVQELQAAAGKSGFQDYSRKALQDFEELYVAAGYPDLEAKALAFSEVRLPSLLQLKQLGRGLADLAKSYQLSGDEASAQAVLQLGMDLGQRTDPASGQWNPLISELVGLGIQSDMLRAMNPASPYDHAGQTVQSRLDELDRYHIEVKAIVAKTGLLLERIPPPDLINYFDRLKFFGEMQASQWVLGKYGPQSGGSTY